MDEGRSRGSAVRCVDTPVLTAQLTVCPTSATSINISRLSPANGQASVLFIAITQQSSRKPSVVAAARHDTPLSLTYWIYYRFHQNRSSNYLKVKGNNGIVTFHLWLIGSTSWWVSISHNFSLLSANELILFFKPYFVRLLVFHDKQSIRVQLLQQKCVCSCSHS